MYNIEQQLYFNKRKEEFCSCCMGFFPPPHSPLPLWGGLPFKEMEEERKKKRKKIKM